MADESPKELFTEAFESLGDIVRNEIELIDLDAELKAKRDGLSNENRQKFAETEKNSLFTLVRAELIKAISKLSKARGPAWKRIKVARGEQLRAHAKKLLDAAESLGADSGGGGGEAEEGFTCPPGFIKVGSVCKRI